MAQQEQAEMEKCCVQQKKHKTNSSGAKCALLGGAVAVSLAVYVSSKAETWDLSRCGAGRRQVND